MAIKDIRDNLKRLKDADPVELASQVNTWLQESGEALRLRVEDEVEKAVTKRGFVKRSEFAKLEARIAALEGQKRVASSSVTRTIQTSEASKQKSKGKVAGGRKSAKKSGNASVRLKTSKKVNGKVKKQVNNKVNKIESKSAKQVAK